jgi:hypothetical protein
LVPPRSMPSAGRGAGADAAALRRAVANQIGAVRSFSQARAAPCTRGAKRSRTVAW